MILLTACRTSEYTNSCTNFSPAVGIVTHESEKFPYKDTSIHAPCTVINILPCRNKWKYGGGWPKLGTAPHPKDCCSPTAERSQGLGQPAICITYMETGYQPALLARSDALADTCRTAACHCQLRVGKGKAGVRGLGRNRSR